MFTCKNTTCLHHDPIAHFACGFWIGYCDRNKASELVRACKKFKRRTDEHEAVVETLKQLHVALKNSQKCEKTLKGTNAVFFAGCRNGDFYALKTLAHKWINRHKRGTQ